MGELAEELQMAFLEAMPVEKRLRGLPAEDRLRGLSSEEVLRRYTPEELAGGLSEEQAARLRKLLERNWTAPLLLAIQARSASECVLYAQTYSLALRACIFAVPRKKWHCPTKAGR